jgi:NAD(P)-dependent dehydrogenase (short-subunit alcohol dehydrogenase family)
MNGSLKDQAVLVIGRGSGIARAVALAARDAGAHVTAAGRDQEKLADAYAGEPGISTETVDLSDEESIAALGKRLGSVHHVVSTASARARGRVADLDRDALRLSFTNAAADTLARSLALELAPIRVNAISPGVIDSGAWDALGQEAKAKYYADMTARNPARRIGTTDDVANTVLFAMTSTFLTGQTLHIDGGEPFT